MIMIIIIIANSLITILSTNALHITVNRYIHANIHICNNLNTFIIIHNLYIRTRSYRNEGKK